MSIFREKVCVVTGGASGLGRALCRQLAAYGADVTVADLNAEAAKGVMQEILERGGKATSCHVDVTEPTSIEKLVNETMARLGRLDFMFNNAGITVIGEFRDLPLDEVMKVLNVNLKGAVNGSHYAYQAMVRQGFGHIVNTASGLGLAPGPTQLPYVMSKFGVVGLSETLRYEGLDLGIRVTAVCPGFIQTSLIENVRTFNASPQDVISQIPVKVVDPDEAARLVLRGVAKNRAIISFPSYVGILTFIYRFFPGLFLRQSLKSIRAFRKIRKEADIMKIT
ncbi:SDR family NAD(P)-dependent oxidoreductase [Paenibacillus sp. LjRoot153]|uniref:SDR family NAD(P)-dependent oxidoreductase n=1 Tax=Paenibacillus sp. LjRoot153 TaxID=3342270 RepID=UPI003ECFA580